MVYNITNLTSSTNLLNIVQTVNVWSEGFFGIMFILVFFVILFIAFKNFPTKTAFVSAMFISTLIAILFKFINLVPDLVVIIGVIGTIVGVSVLFLSGDRGD